jgi:hypothetical protein
LKRHFQTPARGGSDYASFQAAGAHQRVLV